MFVLDAIFILSCEYNEQRMLPLQHFTSTVSAIIKTNSIFYNKKECHSKLIRSTSIRPLCKLTVTLKASIFFNNYL